jgi:hypothetical protein
VTTISIRVVGAEPIADRFSRAPEFMGEIFEANFVTLGKETATIMRDQLRVKNYTGHLERSVTYEVQGGQQPYVAIGPDAEHGVWVKEGTNPHWAPIEPLKRWAAWKLGDERLAYPVQRKIAGDGTEPYDFIEMVLMDGRFQSILANTAERLGIDLVARLEKE